MVVTRGNDGMTLVDDGGARHFPAEAAEVYDVSGAGDTAVATLAAAIAGGADVETAVRLANLAAGVVVGKAGTAVAREADLMFALSPQRSALRKIVPREEAAEQVERWRRRGWRVGFTNGCFDLLHPGHVHLLEEARSKCDRLVVGLNSDASARRLKGPKRPVQPEAARAAVLASLASVDLVVRVRGGHARGADRRAAPGPADEGRRLYAGPGGGRRAGARLGRQGGAG